MKISHRKRIRFVRPLQAWEILHLSTYHRKLLALHAKLSSILEVDLGLARKQQREAISNHESEVAGHALGTLLEYMQALEDCWTGVRWIRDVLSASRLKNAGGISVQALAEWYLNQTESPPDDAQFVSHHDPAAAAAAAPSSSLQVKSANLFKLDTMKNWNTRKRDSAASDSGTQQRTAVGGGGLSRTPTTRSDPQEFGLMDLDHHHHKDTDGNLTNLAHMRSRLLADGGDPPVSYTTSNATYRSNSTNSIDSNENEYAATRSAPQLPAPPATSDILQVYAAYDTGLAHGTSVRIKVSLTTTAREVVDLVTESINLLITL